MYSINLYSYISSLELSCSVRLRLSDFDMSSVRVGSHLENALVDCKAAGKLDDESEDPQVDEDAMLGCHPVLA